MVMWDALIFTIQRYALSCFVMSNPQNNLNLLPLKGAFEANRQFDLEQIIYFTISLTNLPFLYCNTQSSVLYVLQQM